MGVAVLGGEIHGGNRAAAVLCDVARGAADSAARVEHSALRRDPGQIHQLRGGEAAHGVKVLEQHQIGGCHIGQILSGVDQGALDVAPRKSG